MTTRIAAGLEPMNPTIRLHGCRRVGNMVTGLDPASPEGDCTVVFGVSPAAGPLDHVRLIEEMRKEIEAMFPLYVLTETGEVKLA